VGGGRDGVGERDVYNVIGQPHQTDRVYYYTDELKLYNVPPFLLFLDDLEHVLDRTISDCSFQP